MSCLQIFANNFCGFIVDDVKLVAALGLWLGCEKLFNVVLIATIGGGIIALLMILAKQKDRGRYFAYGPYFALAAIYELLTNFCK